MRLGPEKSIKSCEWVRFGGPIGHLHCNPALTFPPKTAPAAAFFNRIAALPR
jgi:hypothetical protein